MQRQAFLRLVNDTVFDLSEALVRVGAQKLDVLPEFADLLSQPADLLLDAAHSLL